MTRVKATADLAEVARRILEHHYAGRDTTRDSCVDGGICNFVEWNKTNKRFKRYGIKEGFAFTQETFGDAWELWQEDDTDTKPELQYGHVYFLQAEGNGLIKIGFTTNLLRRVRDHRNGSPVLLHFLGAYEAQETEERLVHDLFRYHRQHGEWFSPAPEIFKYVEAKCKKDNPATDQAA